MATVETPRSARRRQISEGVKQAGSDLAEGVLDSLVARNSGPARKLKALLVKLDLVSVDGVLNLADGDAHPDSGALTDAAPAAVLKDLAQRVADLDDNDPDKDELAAHAVDKAVLRQVTALLKAMRSAHAKLDEASDAVAARHSLSAAFATPSSAPAPAPAPGGAGAAPGSGAAPTATSADRAACEGWYRRQMSGEPPPRPVGTAALEAASLAVRRGTLPDLGEVSPIYAGALAPGLR